LASPTISWDQNSSNAAAVPSTGTALNASMRRSYRDRSGVQARRGVRSPGEVAAAIRSPFANSRRCLSDLRAHGAHATLRDLGRTDHFSVLAATPRVLAW
jgi:hypothetical protein